MLDGRVMRNACFSCNNYISMLTSTMSLPYAQPAKNRSKILHHILSGSVRNLDTIRPKTGRIAWGRIAWGLFCKLLRMQHTCEDDITATVCHATPFLPSPQTHSHAQVGCVSLHSPVSMQVLTPPSGPLDW